MHFHRKDIFAWFEVREFNEITKIDFAVLARVALLRLARRTNGAGLHVAPEQFLPVKIDNRASIPQQLDEQ